MGIITENDGIVNKLQVIYIPISTQNIKCIIKNHFLVDLMYDVDVLKWIFPFRNVLLPNVDIVLLRYKII